jgi:hypothetical protein
MTVKPNKKLDDNHSPLDCSAAAMASIMVFGFA